MEYSFLFPLMQNYENWSRNARLVIKKLLASFFSGHCVQRSRELLKCLGGCLSCQALLLHIFYGLCLSVCVEAIITVWQLSGRYCRWLLATWSTVITMSSLHHLRYCISCWNMLPTHCVQRLFLMVTLVYYWHRLLRPHTVCTLFTSAVSHKTFDLKRGHLCDS